MRVDIRQKTCRNPKCKMELHRNSNESDADFRKRRHCNRACRVAHMAHLTLIHYAPRFDLPVGLDELSDKPTKSWRELPVNREFEARVHRAQVLIEMGESLNPREFSFFVRQEAARRIEDRRAGRWAA